PALPEREFRPCAAEDGDLGAAAERQVAAGWRRFPGARRRLEREARRSAGADGTVVPSVRESQPLRAAGLLHAARLGLEGKPDGYVRQLARERVVRRVQRPE